MKILFLGGNLASDLAEWLGSQGEEVVYREDKISIEETKEINPDFIISYNYRYIIPKEMISLVSGKAINPHISYLPFNKGYHPNIWSFLDNTPKGVTIHYMDEGIDTGDIIVQKEIPIDESRETLKSSYEILHREIQKLFKENWSKMRKQEITPRPQPEGGSIHYRKEMVKFERFIVENGWDTPIADLKKRYNAWQRIKSIDAWASRQQGDDKGEMAYE